MANGKTNLRMRWVNFVFFTCQAVGNEKKQRNENPATIPETRKVSLRLV
jgi:hypothetical protein